VPGVTASTIDFADGARARVARTPPAAPGGELLRALDVPPPRGLVVVNGSTDEIDDERAQLLRGVVQELARVAAADGLAIVTGGTDAGIFRLLGSVLDTSSVTAIGVAPAGRVTWPGRLEVPDDAVPLEPHHSHFVLVDGDEWGDETSTMMRLVAAMDVPAVALLAGGGDVARRELLAHVHDGRDVVVLKGSGRLADEVAAGRSRDASVRKATSRGHVVPFDIALPAAGLGKLVRKRLRGDRRRRGRAPALLRRFPMPRHRPPPEWPLVSPATRADAPLLTAELAYLEETLVPRFRALDRAALRAQHSFRFASMVLILGGATATSLGAAQAAKGGGSLWFGVAEGIVAAVVAGVHVYARGRGFQQIYLTKRLSAERMKSQYYLFVTRAGAYGGDERSRRTQLRRALDRIEAGEEPA
jgi:hypothetical protein